MGHSYMDYAGKSELFRDIDVAIWVRCIIVESECIQPAMYLSPNLQAMFTFWRTPLPFIGPGCFNLKLDNYIANQEIQEEILLIMDRAMEHIKAFGDIVPSEYLNQANVPSDYDFNDLTTERILSVMEKFRSLLGKEEVR